MSLLRIATIVGLICLLLLVAHSDLSGQQPSTDQLTGKVVGSVADRLGARVQQATIVFESKVAGKKRKFKTKTDRDGAFDISLPAGFYDVSVNFVGFKRFRSKSLSVAANGSSTLDIVLEIDPKKTVTVY